MNDILKILFSILAFPIFFGALSLIGYILDEQEHRHKIELEKVKQGIFDTQLNKKDIQSHLEKILITVVIIAIVVLVFYAFDVPSNFVKYVLSIFE